jgi:hypothetical protein
VDALTPLQCFIAGVGTVLVGSSVLGLFGWRHLAGLRKRDPEFFARLAEESRLKKADAASSEEEGLRLRRREVELMERIVENQEVMIGLLRQSLEEKATP